MPAYAAMLCLVGLGPVIAILAPRSYGLASWCTFTFLKDAKKEPEKTCFYDLREGKQIGSRGVGQEPGAKQLA